MVEPSKVLSATTRYEKINGYSFVIIQQPHKAIFVLIFKLYFWSVTVSMCNSRTNAQHVLNSCMQLFFLAAINLITAIYALTLPKYRFSSHVWKAAIDTTTVSTNLICHFRHFLSKKSVREWNSYLWLTLDAYLF